MGKARSPRRTGWRVAVSKRAGLVQTLLGLLSGLLALTLATAAVLAHRSGSRGLRDLVGDDLAETRVGNPVTAVLLDFRGYDTLLEVGVLLLAWAAATMVGRSGPVGVTSESRQGARVGASSPERSLAGILLAPLLLVAAYLLWRGADGPGGALQSAAVAAAAVVAWRIGSGTSSPLLPEHGRWLAPGALAAFLVAGGTVGMVSGSFLDYPRAIAREVMMCIEIVTAVSVAYTFVALFETVLGVGSEAR